MPLVIYIALPRGVDRQVIALIVTFKVVAIVISVYTAAQVTWDLVRDQRKSPASADDRPTTQQRLGEGGHPSNLAYEFGKRAILTTRVMVFLGAVSVIIRSGAHISFDSILPPIGFIATAPDAEGLHVVGYMDVPILLSYSGLDVVYYGFGLASFVFGIGALARLNSLILIGSFLEKKRVRQPRDGVLLFWVVPLALLWITLFIALTKEIIETLKGHLELGYIDYLNFTLNRRAIFILYWLFCSWIALAMLAITTGTIRRLVHASRAGILTGRERKTMKTHGIVLFIALALLGLVYLIPLIEIIIRPFLPYAVTTDTQTRMRYWITFVIEVVGLPLLILWAGYMARRLADNPEKMMGITFD